MNDISNHGRLEVVMPSYKKADVIVEAIERACRALVGSFESVTFIVVVDGLVDETVQQITESKLENVEILVHPVNLGKGASLKTGVNVTSAPLVAFLDADLDIDPEAIVSCAQIFALEPSCSVVIGSKRLGDSWQNYPAYRRILSRTYSLLSRIFVGNRLPDTQTGLKLFRGEIIRELANSVKTNGFSFDLELMALAQIRGIRISEVPVTLTYDSYSTLDFRSAARAVTDLMAISRILRSK